MNTGRITNVRHDRINVNDVAQLAAVLKNAIPEVTIKCVCQSTPSRPRYPIRKTKTNLMSNSGMNKKRFSAISSTACAQEGGIFEQQDSVLHQINKGALYPKYRSKLSVPHALFSGQISGCLLYSAPDGYFLLIQGKNFERTTSRINKSLSLSLCPCNRSVVAATRPSKFVKDFDDSLLINGETYDLMLLLGGNESLRTPFLHGDVENGGQIVVIGIVRSNDIWDRFYCLKDFCKPYPLYVTPALERRRIPGKVHYRIDCQELEQPSDFLDGKSRRVLEVLEFNNKIGIGLRDFSATNVLSLGGVGQLCDIGHENNGATCFRPNINTGTSLFLAFEVESKGYHFIPLATLSSDQLWAIFKLPVLCNLLHDLESAWWSFFWTVLNGSLVKFTQKNRDIMSDYKFARLRLRYIRDATKYTMDYLRVDPSQTSNPVVVMLHAVRMRLLSLYQKIEINTEVDDWDFTNLHHEIIEAFDDANLEKCRAQLEDDMGTN
ncbi:hypothetical protein BD410DRAFT_832346 [Rickenella mellea]|uniref:Fungal-type protein kinase domain-containing protein n=1 Tax=Rickenella mellea TaxID=50990 RepID=A0A4Y7PKG5_9AGAM|nr:hypothetical protein BD410DRAFT_832346 [Rickenella mellea]